MHKLYPLHLFRGVGQSLAHIAPGRDGFEGAAAVDELSFRSVDLNEEEILVFTTICKLGYHSR